MINPNVVEGQIAGGRVQGIGGVALRAPRLRRGRQPARHHLHGLPAAHGRPRCRSSNTATSRPRARARGLQGGGRRRRHRAPAGGGQRRGRRPRSLRRDHHPAAARPSRHPGPAQLIRPPHSTRPPAPARPLHGTGPRHKRDTAVSCRADPCPLVVVYDHKGTPIAHRGTTRAAFVFRGDRPPPRETATWLGPPSRTGNPLLDPAGKGTGNARCPIRAR